MVRQQPQTEVNASTALVLFQKRYQHPEQLRLNPEGQLFENQLDIIPEIEEAEWAAGKYSTASKLDCV